MWACIGFGCLLPFGSSKNHNSSDSPKTIQSQDYNSDFPMAGATRLVNSQERSNYSAHKTHRVSKKLFFRSEGVNSGHLGSSLVAAGLKWNKGKRGVL